MISNKASADSCSTCKYQTVLDELPGLSFHRLYESVPSPECTVLRCKQGLVPEDLSLLSPRIPHRYLVTAPSAAQRTSGVC